MITILRDGEQYVMKASNEEQLTIDKMLSKHNRKLEKHIEDYLASRKVNIREQENMLIMQHMSELERQERLKDIEEKDNYVPGIVEGKKENNA